MIKKYSAKVIGELRALGRNTFIVADFKTLDVGKVEVGIAFDENASGVQTCKLCAENRSLGFINAFSHLGRTTPKHFL